MRGVGPSTVLGGRYTVQRRLEQMPGAERWSAHDTTLERDVALVCFEAAGPNADAALDAARRAAGLDNPRLVRLLDVGRSDDLAFFVEEALTGGHTLTSLLEQGGLPSEEVRRIAGEAATGLEAARARGLHHLQLTPSSILRTADGTVKVRGLATTAALAGVDELDSTAASRADAIGVVAVAYAGLTSRWPLPSHVPGVETAPLVIGGVPAPSEIAAGVPGDLDALCRLTLNDDEGPLTPGDFATQIAPWSQIEVTGLGGSPRPSGAEGAATRGVNKTLALPIGGAAAGAAAAGPAAASSVAAGQTAGAASDETPKRRVGRPAGGPDEPYDLQSDEKPPAPGRHAAPSGRHAADEAEGEHAGAAAAAAAAAAAGAVGTALGTAGHAAGHAAGVAAGKVGTYARAAADKAAEKRAARLEAEERAERARISLDDALLAGAEEIGPPLPMLPPETAAAPTRDQSKLVMGIIAGFLAVATVLGFWGVSRIGSNSNLGLTAGNTPRQTVTVTGAPTTVPPSAAPTTTAEGARQPLAILKANGFDPEGDGNEHNPEAPRIYDGNPATFWKSDGYNSANLGGLKKGVGVIIDLGQPAKVNEVKLNLPDAADFTVYLAEQASVQGATALGTSAGKKGALTIASQDTEASGQYVIVWFTKVSQVSDGRFRATLAEVSLN